MVDRNSRRLIRIQCGLEGTDNLTADWNRRSVPSEYTLYPIQYYAWAALISKAAHTLCVRLVLDSDNQLHLARGIARQSVRADSAAGVFASLGE